MSAEGEIRIEVTRDKRDYISAVWANYLNSGGVWWVFGGAIVFGAAIFAIEVFSGAYQPWIAGTLAALGYALAMIVLNAIMLTLAARQSWRQPGAFDVTTFIFTPDALDVQSEVGSGRTQWVVWRRAFENSRVLAIRHQINIVQFLPKRQIPPETLPRLRELLRTALGGRVAFAPDGKS